MNATRGVKRPANSNPDFAGLTLRSWGQGFTVRHVNGKTKIKPDLKAQFLEFHGKSAAAKRPKAGNQARQKTVNNKVNATEAKRHHMDIDSLQKAMKKFKDGVQVFPGMGRNNRELNILQAVLNAQLRHFSDPAVRQSYSGGVLETTSFAVAAVAASFDVWYFDDPALSKDITKLRKDRLPHGFILKSAFSLDNTIKNPNIEKNEGLFKIWKKIIGLAATTTSRTNPDVRKWLENTKSPFKGFFEVQPDVLEWIPPSPSAPNGRIRIYELKVGIGKPEAAPAEAYQLLKAKRAIELLFIKSAEPPPSIELYFLPWMYGTPEGAIGKFTNYVNNQRYKGSEIHENFKKLGVANGYKVKELTKDTFKTLTKMDPEIMTTILDVFRKQQANNSKKIQDHIHRHRLGLRGVTSDARQVILGALTNSRFPTNEKKEASVIERQLRSLMPRNKIPPGMNSLAALVAHPKLVSQNATKERSSIATRALNMLGYRKGSKYLIYHRPTGKIQNNPGGVSANNEYLSNNNTNNNANARLNNRNLQRLRAAYAKLETLAPRARYSLNAYNVYTKTGVPVEGASHANAKILAQVIANQNNFAKAYGLLLKNLNTLPENKRRALFNNFKKNMNILAEKNGTKYKNKRNYVKQKELRAG
jgi:gas vesicle protein